MARTIPDAALDDRLGWVLAAESGQSASSSGYANNLGALRSIGFIDYPRGGEVVALPVLFLER